MLKVKTVLKESNIEGLGVFANQEIQKGTVIWEYDSRFDISFNEEDLKNMDIHQVELIKKYAYFSQESKKYIYSIDDSRFINHSSFNNNMDVVDMGKIETSGVANRDIKKGEEILVNYKLFDANDAQSNEEYLNN